MGAQTHEVQTTRELTITSADALDAAYRGENCEVIRADGTSRTMPTRRWTGPASEAEIALFVRPCFGSTLDVGCGPGRLTEALAKRGVPALGVDISPEAVRLTRERGALAICQDIFDKRVPLNSWQHVVLADGNIGLGGDPVRLLVRVAELLRPEGTILVELTGTGHMRLHDSVQLRVAGRTTPPFSWATVGTRAIADLAGASGLHVAGLRGGHGRQVATLHHEIRQAASCVS